MVKHKRHLQRSHSAPSGSALLTLSALKAGVGALVGSTSVGGSRWRKFGRASGVFSVGLFAALLTPRQAKAVNFYTDNTATAIGVGTGQTACSDTIVSYTLTVNGVSTPTTTPDYGCYTNWLETVDIDGDGDMDIVEANGGGYYTTGVAEQSTVYLNDGKGVFTDVTSSAFGNPHSRLRQVATGDVDGDGDMDIYEPGGFGADLDKLFIQTSPGVFTDMAATNLPITGLSSHAASTHMGDLDGDGDLDIVVSDWGSSGSGVTPHLIMYKNDGTGKFTFAAGQYQADPSAVSSADVFPPTFGLQSGATIDQSNYGGVRPIDIDFADIDNDFDLDIVIDMRNGFSRLFINDGTGHFSDGTHYVATKDPVTSKVTATTNYPLKQGPYVYNQELCDIDQDGDLDLLLDNSGPKSTNPPNPAGGGTNVSQVLINDGKGKFTDQTLDYIVGEPTSDDNAVKCADLNNDGKYDLLVASLQNTSEKVLLNDGTGKMVYQADGFPTITDSTLAIDLADFNGDGLLDVVTGQGEGGASKDGSNLTTVRNNRIYFGAGASAVDTVPPVFREVETPTPVSGKPIVIRAAVRDRVTSEVGQEVTGVTLTYTVPSSSAKVVKGTFIGGDLFRMVIPVQPPGTSITYTLSTTDRANNTTTTPAVTISTPAEVGEGGMGGAAGADTAGEAGAMTVPGQGGEAGISEAGGATSTAGATNTAGKGGSATAGTPGVEEGGEAGSTMTVSSDDSGCGCSTAPGHAKNSALLAGLGAAIFGLSRRRRNKK